MSRIAIVLFILLVLVTFGLVMTDGQHQTGVFTRTRYYLAQIGSGIGVTVSILPNPFNSAARQLEEKESKLSVLDQKLQQREAALGEREQAKEDTTTLYVILVGGTLFLLVVLNFYLDYRRRKSM